jgi:hypothetical protein
VFTLNGSRDVQQADIFLPFVFFTLSFEGREWSASFALSGPREVKQAILVLPLAPHRHSEPSKPTFSSHSSS